VITWKNTAYFYH